MTVFRSIVPACGEVEQLEWPACDETEQPDCSKDDHQALRMTPLRPASIVLRRRQLNGARHDAANRDVRE